MQEREQCRVGLWGVGGGKWEQSKSFRSYAINTVTSGCLHSALAGNSSLTSSERRRSIAARLLDPLARSTIDIDARIVAMPIVIACVGTLPSGKRDPLA